MTVSCSACGSEAATHVPGGPWCRELCRLQRERLAMLTQAVRDYHLYKIQVLETDPPGPTYGEVESARLRMLALVAEEEVA